MPIVACQHQWKESSHVPLDGWPDDCTVQWGSHGVVLSQKPDGSYKAAFFEAFPQGGGFIRGEGETLADAEASAFAKYLKISACDHGWSRKGYTNGGAICRHCGAFQTVFRPIVVLGAHRKPLSPTSLDLLAEGSYRPCVDDPRQHSYQRRQWLKAKRMGIQLPDFETAPPAPCGFDEDDYAKASRLAVASFLRENMSLLETSSDGLGLTRMFEGLHITSLRRMLEDSSDEMGLLSEP